MNNEENDINLPADADDLSKHAPALFALKGTETGFVVPALYFEELSELVIAKTSIPEDGGLVVPENYFEELSAVVEAKTVIPSQDGLTVPQDYFEELSAIIEAKLILPTESGLVVPENYFEEFSTNLESLIALPAFDSAQSDNTIPAGYFSEMENELHVHIALDNLKQEDGFVVPEGYFENLTSRVLAETILDKDNINNDEVPDGYFDALPGKVISRIEGEGDKKEEGGRVIVFAQWKKYTAITAVAAAVALLIVFTWTFIGNSDAGIGELRVAHNTPNLVPDNYVHIPQPKIDTTPEIVVVVPDAVVVQLPKKRKDIKPLPQNNVIEQKNTTMSNEEIIAQSDVMDESMVMDFVAEGGMIQPTDEVPEADMMEYLMNDNAGLEIFDPTDKKK